MAELTSESLDETRRILASAEDYDNPDIHEARAVLTHRVPPLLDEIERLRAENRKLREDVATRILTATLPHCRATRDLERAGVELPLSLHFEGYDLAADITGVPADNTSEMDVTGFVMETGEWPEGVYCRDWLVNLWCEVEDGKATIADVVAALVEAAQEAGT